MTRTARSVFYWTHVLGGLTAGGVLAVMAATGALLLFKPELDERLNPELLTVRPGAEALSADTLLAAAQAVRPADQPSMIRISGRPDATATVMFQGRAVVYLDPSTGAVAGSRNYFEGLFGRAEQLHRYLLMGDLGRILTGGAALVYVGLFLSGLVLSGRFRSCFRLDPRLRGRARLLQLHKVAGAYLGGLVLLSALSGLPHAFGWFKQGLYKVMGEAPAPAPVATAMGRTTRPRLLAHAQTVLRQMSPGARDVYFLLPAKPDSPLTTFYIAADAPHAHARNYVWFDPATGAVLKVVPYAESLRGDRLYFASIALHFGQFAGGLGRPLMLAGCVGLLLLVITGVTTFWRKIRARPGVAARDQTAQRLVPLT